MKTKKYYIIIIIAIANIINAQTPGYMGKRFNVGYGFYTSPATIGSNGKVKSMIGRQPGNAETGTFAWNTFHELFIETALKNRLSIGLSARYFKTTSDNSLSTAYTSTSANNGQIYMNIDNGNVRGYYTMRGFNYCLYGKLFNKNYVAPWGKYFTFGLCIKSFKCIYDTNVMFINARYSTYNKKFSNFGPNNQRFTRFDILTGFGRTRIIANNISIDYGFNTQVFALMASLFDFIGEDEFIDRTTSDSYFEQTSRWRLRGLNRFNAYIKIGYLF